MLQYAHFRFFILQIRIVTLGFYWLIAFSSVVDLEILYFCLKVDNVIIHQYILTKFTNYMANCVHYNRHNCNAKVMTRFRNIQLLVLDVYRTSIFVTLDATRVYVSTDYEG